MCQVRKFFLSDTGIYTELDNIFRDFKFFFKCVKFIFKIFVFEILCKQVFKISCYQT